MFITHCFLTGWRKRTQFSRIGNGKRGTCINPLTTPSPVIISEKKQMSVVAIPSLCSYALLIEEIVKMQCTVGKKSTPKVKKKYIRDKPFLCHRFIISTPLNVPLSQTRGYHSRVLNYKKTIILKCSHNESHGVGGSQVANGILHCVNCQSQKIVKSCGQAQVPQYVHL